MSLKAVFKELQDEYLKFERIENPLHHRADICGFMKLHQLVPGTMDMVAAAEHVEIFLDVSPEALERVATVDDLVYLHRCGVRWNSDADSLAMFV